MYRYQQYIYMGMVILGTSFSVAFDCRSILEDEQVTYINWANLENCLQELSGEILTKAANENIWRLVKTTFNGIDNIPTDVYKNLGFALTGISINELHNISFERVETVEAFGAVSKAFGKKGFSLEKNKIIALKVRHEWLGKNPRTYSQYDLMSMGEFLCYLNVSDIEDIRPDILREAAEWIGNLENCPQETLEALARLATAYEAFGAPSTWSKLQVIIIGNIINGLPNTELTTIDKNKLHLNRFYQNKRGNAENNTHSTTNNYNQTDTDFSN